MPPGIGNPVADKLHAALAGAMMSINATKGFEYGIGFRAPSAKGSQIADTFLPSDDKDAPLRTATNYSGGIQGAYPTVCRYSSQWHSSLPPLS